jgi:hypothetical protein
MTQVLKCVITSMPDAQIDLAQRREALDLTSHPEHGDAQNELPFTSSKDGRAF